MAWKSPSKKKRSSASGEAAALERLALVRKRREPFAQLLRSIVDRTLDELLPPDGDVLEIGSGDGQLYRHLPDALRPRLLHTEPLAAASRGFRKRYPDAKVVEASAEALPVSDGALSAVLGLCVLDVVDDGAAVARELQRVLKPGGRLIHFLDMSTKLDPLVADLAQTQWVPLPNVFADPSAQAWPEDLFIAPLSELSLVASVLLRHGHALGRPLAQYLALLGRSPPAPSAAAELAQLQESAPLRGALRTMFRAAFELAEPELRPQLAGFQGRPLSSARHFAQRLAGWFGPETGFAVRRLEVQTAWEKEPRSDATIAYISACVGEHRELPSAPETRLCPDSENPMGNHALRELGVLVLVAERQRQLAPEK